MVNISTTALNTIDSERPSIKDICKVMAYLVRTHNPSVKKVKRLKGIDVWNHFTDRGQDLSSLIGFWDEYRYMFGSDETRTRLELKYK